MEPSLKTVLECLDEQSAYLSLTEYRALLTEMSVAIRLRIQDAEEELETKRMGMA